MLTLTAPNGNTYTDSQRDLRKVWERKWGEEPNATLFFITIAENICEVRAINNDGIIYESTVDIPQEGYTVSFSDSIPASNVRAFLEDIAQDEIFADDTGEEIVYWKTLEQLVLKHFGNLNESNKKD